MYAYANSFDLREQARQLREEAEHSQTGSHRRYICRRMATLREIELAKREGRFIGYNYPRK